jgi:hypothetical protein
MCTFRWCPISEMFARMSTFVFMVVEPLIWLVLAGRESFEKSTS